MKCPKCGTVNASDSQYCKKCATPLPPEDGGASFTRTLETTADELVRGALFAGRYEIIEELGTGGMGRVYRAHDTKLNEEVALKLIRPEIAAEKRTVERFRNEIKVAQKISHKNVCRTHDLHEEGKTFFITMEYVRGEDLKSLIRQTRTLAAGTAVEAALPATEGAPERALSRTKPVTSRKVTVKLPPRKLLIPAAALILLAASLLFWRPWSRTASSVPPPIVENSIAIISFENQTGDEASDYMCRRVIPDTLIVNLENSGLFALVPTWERMEDVLRQMGKRDVQFINRELGFDLCRR